MFRSESRCRGKSPRLTPNRSICRIRTANECIIQSPLMESCAATVVVSLSQYVSVSLFADRWRLRCPRQLGVDEFWGRRRVLLERTDGRVILRMRRGRLGKVNSGWRSSNQAIHRPEVRSFGTERERTGSGNGGGLGVDERDEEEIRGASLAQTKKELSLPSESRYGREPDEGWGWRRHLMERER